MKKANENQSKYGFQMHLLLKEVRKALIIWYMLTKIMLVMF